MNALMFNDYYDRRASSGKEHYMNPSSSNPIAKSHSLDYLADKNFQSRNPSDEYLEFSKTPNFRSRRDAVFEPIGNASRTHLGISSDDAGPSTSSDKVTVATKGGGDSDKLGRVTVTMAPIVQNQAMKRKATAMDRMEVGEGPKKLKHG